MASTIDSEFLTYSADKLRQQSGRIAECLAKLTEEQVWARGAENENAIGNIVLHLCGNVRQWIVASVGKTPDTRQRDLEFSTRAGVTIADLTQKLRATTDEAAQVIAGAGDMLAETRVIQNYEVSVLEAIYHV